MTDSKDGSINIEVVDTLDELNDHNFLSAISALSKEEIGLFSFARRMVITRRLLDICKAYSDETDVELERTLLLADKVLSAL